MNRQSREPSGPWSQPSLGTRRSLGCSFMPHFPWAGEGAGQARERAGASVETDDVASGETVSVGC